MKKYLKILIYSLNILALISLILSYLSVYISPDSFWPLAFFGLAYPIIFFVNLIFLALWIIRKKYLYCIVIGFLLLLGWSYISRTIQINFTADKERTEKTLKIMSYNVKLFALYDWKNNEKLRNSMFDYIVDEQPDIICFQEFYYEDIYSFPTLDSLLVIQKAVHPHIHDMHKFGKYHFGIATFSVYPIINQGNISFDFSNNCAIFSDIVFNGDTVRIYNNHLESVRFMPEDYGQIDSLTTSFDESKYKGMMKKLKNAYKLRSRQVEIISEHIENSPYPVIVCGDFNDTPVSYAYRIMKGDLWDAFKRSGSGFGATYNGSIPFQRIDYIFYSDEFTSSNYTTGDVASSDHYPIHCLIEWDK